MEDLPDDLIIWKYMELPKFFDMLYDKHLFFSNVRLLPDLYECSFPELRKKTKDIEKLKDLVFVNCWTIAEEEDYALWKVYLNNSKYGVAIRTTIGNLKSCLQLSSPYNLSTIRIRRVNYSYKLEKISIESIVCTKKPFYKYENELRLWIRAVYNEDVGSDGIKIIMDIDRLIESIYISPFMPYWFNMSLIDIVNKYKGDTFLSSKLIPSSIREKEP